MIDIFLCRATSPPSFALEVFVQSEGETRFRRLCQPFLYSHSSSNVLEVEVFTTFYVIFFMRNNNVIHYVWNQKVAESSKKSK